MSFHVPTSQLEIMTFAFAICTIITYYVLLDKPKDPRVSIEVAADRYATPPELARRATAGLTCFGLLATTICIPNTAIHYDRAHHPTAFNRNLVVGAAFSLFIFGAMHCIA